ncbi:ComEC/Rec2 family competence protein [Kribbia dieselivorans]|uniref:ComEC/Rec2 family competence protein n=1 Tax=Kribbia dieselivorans TaxID=331526 RepID=UPI000AAB48AD|nr:ComEC/Rec2 family competence protein [Kribbia dieselivorans]
MNHLDRSIPTIDLRLLLPAAVAWAVTATTIVWAPGDKARLAGMTAALGLVVAVALIASGSRPRCRSVAVWTAATALLTVLTVSASAAQGASRMAGPVGDLTEARASVGIEATVLAEPILRTVPKRGTRMAIVRVRIDQVTGRGQTTTVRTPVLVFADESWAALHWRDRIQARGRLGPLTDPGEFLAALRAHGEATLIGEPDPARAAAEHMRSGLRAAVGGLPPDAQGLVPGLVIGDTSLTPPDLTEAMLATGMSHLSAVSGSNVSLVLVWAIGLARLFGLPRRVRPWFALALLAWFVVLARPEPSVIRAATMGAIGVIGLSASRRGAGAPVLAAAIVLLLVYDPWLSRSYGFALSSLATLGLLLFVRPWGEAVNTAIRRVVPQVGERLTWVGPALAIPVAAHLTTAPVVVLLQGSVSLISIAANLVAAPFVAPATIGGLATAMVALLNHRASTWVAWVPGVPAWAIGRVARIAESVPGGTLPWPDGPPGAWLLAGLTVLGVLMAPWVGHRVGRGAARRPVAVSAVAGVTAAAGLVHVVAPLPSEWPPPGWRVVVCDVGQGDAIVVATGPGRALLVDAGPDPELIDGCLRRLHVTRLDALVLTHFHDDHVRGLTGALANREVGPVFMTPEQEPAWSAEQTHRELAERGLVAEVLTVGSTLTVGEATAQVWWPAQRITSGSIPNNNSLVLAVESGGARALLTADVEREAARMILTRLRRDPALAASAGTFDLLKTPHHGSANYDPDFLATVAAPAAVISVGRDNEFGHPADEHVSFLESVGSSTTRTDENGDVALVATPQGTEIVTSRGRAAPSRSSPGRTRRCATRRRRRHR